MLFNLLLFQWCNSNLLFIHVIRGFYIFYWCYILLLNRCFYRVLFKRFVMLFIAILHNYFSSFSIVVYRCLIGVMIIIYHNYL